MSDNTRYAIPDRRNLFIMVTLLAAWAALLQFGSRAAGLTLAATAIAFALVMNAVYAVIHEAEHGILFSDRRLNDVAGAAMALLFPAPFHLIRQGHIGHHQRNRSDDEAFDYWFDGEHPLWKRLQFYGILTGFYWAVVVLSNLVVLLYPRIFDRSKFEFDRPSAAFMDSLNPAWWRIIRIEALLVLATHTALLFWLDLRVMPYLVLYLTFGVSWSALQYVHHFGTERDVLNGARNLWIGWPIDALWLNHNWHLTHHRHPTIPWLYLPDVAREEERAERHFLPFVWLRMWRGPRYTDQRVRNRYAGRVIR